MQLKDEIFYEQGEGYYFVSTGFLGLGARNYYTNEDDCIKALYFYSKGAGIRKKGQKR